MVNTHPCCSQMSPTEHEHSDQGEDRIHGGETAMWAGTAGLG